MEQLDLLKRLVSSRNSLGDASVSDIGLWLVVDRCYFSVTTWHRHGFVLVFPLEKWEFAVPVVVIDAMG